MGNGDQDNYLKIALTAANGAGGLQVVYENAGVPTTTDYPLPSGIPSATLDFYLSVNPLNGTVQPKYSADGGPITTLGPARQVGGELLAALQDGHACAVGLIATSRATSSFTATWDFVYVTTDQTGPNSPPTVATPIPDNTATIGTAFTYTFPATTFSDPNNDPLSYLAHQADGSALPAWLSFTGSTRTFSGTPPAGPTTPASYTIRVTANDGRTGVVTDTFVLSITSPTGTVVYRLNAGGGALSTGRGAFAADQGFSPAPGFTYATTSPIAATPDPALYQTERSAATDQGSFAYALPLANGTYSVVLHFAEIYWTSPAKRLFDVSIEGAKVLDNYDIVQKAGAFTATSETFTTTVSDGALSLYFSALPADGGLDRPKVSAIEVYSTGPTSAAPVANAGPDQSLTLPTSTTTLAGAGTVASGRSLTAYAWSQVGTGPAAVSFSSKTVANPTLSGLTVAGTYTFALVVTDNTGASSAADQVLVTVNPAPAPTPGGTVVYRLNAGGGALSTGRGAFAADQGFSPAPGFTYATTSPIAATPDPALYQTERSAATDQGSFAYALPLANGTYSVVLHFAEIYWTSPAKRLFDVSIEGAKVLDNYDIVQKAGAFTATSETFTTTVSDGALSLYFSALPADGGLDRPKVSAIEVYSTGPTSAAPVANAGPDQSLTLPTSTTTLSRRRHRGQRPQPHGLCLEPGRHRPGRSQLLEQDRGQPHPERADRGRHLHLRPGRDRQHRRQQRGRPGPGHRQPRSRPHPGRSCPLPPQRRGRPGGQRHRHLRGRPQLQPRSRRELYHHRRHQRRPRWRHHLSNRTLRPHPGLRPAREQRPAVPRRAPLRRNLPQRPRPARVRRLD